MRIIKGYDDLQAGLVRPAVTIGNFDGVHLGHQQVMRAALAGADERGVASVVCTFHPHTAEVLRPGNGPPMLQTLEQRLASIASLGVDVAVVIPFDREIAATGHRRFVDSFLRAELDVGSLHVSQGFSFGRDSAGSTAYLERRAAECGFTVERVPPLIVGDEPVSSTRVRNRLALGDVEGAADLLGRPFAVVGSVVEGEGRGRRLRVPTANLAVGEACLPGRGVYVCTVSIEGQTHPAVTNVGRRPTFEGDGELVVETHLLDGARDLYDLQLELVFLRRLREERRFASAEALREQIAFDIGQARAHFDDARSGL
jgi:riboflavin kinase/FMN adenylyltransferase